jgi:hypothetical protein
MLGNKMEFEIYQVTDEGTKVAVTSDKINDALTPHNVLILIDHTHRKIYNFNGRDSSIRARFCGARLAAGPIRGELGLSYSISSVDEGEETGDFRELLKNMSIPGNAMVSRILDRPPPPLPSSKRSAPKEAVESPKPAVNDNARNAVNTEPAISLQNSPSNPGTIDPPTNVDVSSIAKEFGEIPEGYDMEAMIIRDAVYKCIQVQATVFGKQMDQTRIERVNEVDGTFTLDGQIRVLAKNGVINGIQILTKQKSGSQKKSKQTAPE